MSQEGEGKEHRDKTDDHFPRGSVDRRFTVGVWAVVGGGAGGSTSSIDIPISRYNMDEDIKNYAALLSDNGPDALRAVRQEKEPVRD